MAFVNQTRYDEKKVDATHYCTTKVHEIYSFVANEPSHEIGNKAPRLWISHLKTKVIAATDYNTDTLDDIAN
jgi:hypothetical protein